MLCKYVNYILAIKVSTVAFAHLVVHSIQQSRHSRHDGGLESLHIFSQSLDVAAVKADRAAHHVHGILAATLQHMCQRQKTDQRVTGHDPVITHLHLHRAYRRYDALVCQHDALGVAGGARCVTYRAKVRRLWRQLRMTLLGAETLDVVVLVQFNATVFCSLVRRRSRFFYHY